MKKLSLFSLLFVCLFSASLPTKGQAIQYIFDKKVIYTDSLQVARNTMAYSLLTMLPEMLQRPGDTFLSHYDVQINDMSVGSVSDVALTNLMIDDLERIEVYESPIKSYMHDGVGGVINLVLRSKGEKGKDTWGSASVSVAYPREIAPQLLIGHKGEKVSVKGLFLSDVYRVDYAEENLQYDNTGAFVGSSCKDYDFNYKSQLANVYFNYTPSSKDVLDINLSETYSSTKTDEMPDHNTDLTQVAKSRTTNLTASTTYKHYFKRSYMSASGQYYFFPNSTDRFVPYKQKYNKDAHSNKVAGNVKYITPLLPATSKTSLELTVGTSFNYLHNADDLNNQLIDLGNAEVSHPDNHSLFLQPYTTFKLKTGKWNVQLSGELQHYHYNIDRQGDTYSTSINDVTGQFITEWNITKKDILRLTADRKLNRPSEDQLFPILLYNVENLLYQKGNPYLTPLMSHEISMNYISHRHKGQHTFVLDSRISYNHISDIINTKGETDADGTSYLTYVNEGNNTIWSGNLMALYCYKIFMVTFTGNAYHKCQEAFGNKSHYTYYNLSVHPQFTLTDGWHGGVQFVYNSKVHLTSGTLSDCATVQMSVGKRWKGLYVHFFDRVALFRKAQNKVITPTGKTLTNYDLVTNMVGVGIKYTF